jgi:hypothetical protein
MKRFFLLFLLIVSAANLNAHNNRIELYRSLRQWCMDSFSLNANLILYKSKNFKGGD